MCHVHGAHVPAMVDGVVSVSVVGCTHVQIRSIKAEDEVFNVFSSLSSGTFDHLFQLRHLANDPSETTAEGSSLGGRLGGAIAREQAPDAGRELRHLFADLLRSSAELLADGVRAAHVRPGIGLLERRELGGVKPQHADHDKSDENRAAGRMRMRLRRNCAQHTQ